MTSGISSAVRNLVMQAGTAQAGATQGGGGALAGGGGFLQIIAQSLQTTALSQMQGAEGGQAIGTDMLAALIESLKKKPTSEAMAAVMELFAQSPQLAQAFASMENENQENALFTTENAFFTMKNATENAGGSISELIGKLSQGGEIPKEYSEKIASFLESLSQSQKQSVNEKISKLDNFQELFQKLSGEVVKEQGEIAKTENTEEYLSMLKAVNQNANSSQPTKKQKSENDVDESDIKVFTVKDIMTTASGNIEVKEPDKVEAPRTDKFEIINQFKESFLENISKKRFTVRLKPEGLGEITVNMLNNDGKLSLSILASNQTVQKALEGNLSNLQSSLKQYNAEITSINETAGKQQSALDLNYGREHNQNQHGGQNQHSHHKFEADYYENISEEAQDMMNLREYLLSTNSLSIKV
ncbi:MAG: flagellar hook-length control protein FliK [Oscillospiraceae bacterium]